MPPRHGGEAPAPAVSLSRHERGVRGGGGLERRAVHMSAGRTRGLRWGSCGEERIACASHVLTCHVVSSTSRPERRASHHATRSGPAHMSMIEVLRARTTMFACAGVCRHFSEPHDENGITITNHGFGNPPRSHVAVARPRFHRRPRRRWRCPRAPIPQCPRCQNCSLHANPPVPVRPRHTGTHRRKHRRAAAVCRGALGRDHTSNNTVTNGASGR